MSIDPETSPFEEALRADLPSAETEARLRRRLLAAGLAVGSSAATTVAAAGSTTATTVAAGSSAAAGGLMTNVVGMSWGIKLGFAAAVAIPTLGLLVESSGPEASHSPPAPSAAIVATAPRATALAAPPVERAAPLEAEASSPSAPAEVPARAVLAPASVSTRREVAPVTAPERERAELPAARAFDAALEAPAVSPPRATTLAEETRLLDAAFAELAAGNHARATQLLAEHESRYPQGLLSKERERAKSKLSELSRGN